MPARPRRQRLGLLAVLAAGLLAGAAASTSLADSGAPKPGGADAALAVALDDYLRARSEGGAFSGAVLVARRGEVVFRAAHGMADAEHGVALAPESIFRIGSLTKPLTATATMAMVARGQLRLDDSICRFLAGCPESWRTVTLHHLLSHTSGIPDLFGEVEEAPLEETRAAIDRAVAAHGSAAPVAAPGERYAYSNFNYALLGYAMEVAGRKGWEELLRETVFGPAGMTATRYDDVWAIVPGRVRGYARDGHGLRNLEYDDHSAYAAGGLLSTVDDLHAFHRALSDGRLLAPEMRERMLTPVLERYGYGFHSMTVFGSRAVGHYGAIDGFTSFLVHVPERHLLVVALENVEGDSARATACDLLALASGAPWPLLSSAGATTAAAGSAQRMVGSYGSSGEEPRRIESVDGALRYRRGTLDLRMIPVAGGVWALQGSLDILLDGVGPPDQPASELRARRCGEALFAAPRVPAAAGG